MNKKLLTILPFVYLFSSYSLCLNIYDDDFCLNYGYFCQFDWGTIYFLSENEFTYDDFQRFTECKNIEYSGDLVYITITDKFSDISLFSNIVPNPKKINPRDWMGKHSLYVNYREDESIIKILIEDENTKIDLSRVVWHGGEDRNPFILEDFIFYGQLTEYLYTE